MSFEGLYLDEGGSEDTIILVSVLVLKVMFFEGLYLDVGGSEDTFILASLSMPVLSTDSSVPNITLHTINSVVRMMITPSNNHNIQKHNRCYFSQ